VKGQILALLAVVLVLLPSCNAVEPDDGKLIAEAKAVIAKELSDPEKAKFKNVYVAPGGEQRINGIVCGEVLGTFKSGKQGDYRVFVYAKLADFAGIEELPAPGEEVLPEAKAYQAQFDALWVSNCMTE
jgi:hypothetical protein